MPALEALRLELGLTWPITIRIIHGDLTTTGERKSETQGVRRSRDGRHLIDIRADLDPEDATRVIAHESWHCAQCERHGDKWGERYRAARDAYGYRASHFEVAARTFAQAIVNRGTPLATG
jgi:hypothetical protein